MKKTSLIWQMAIFFFLVFITFGFIVLNEKGNPLVQYKAKEALQSYIKENFPTINNDFLVSDISYQAKDQSYFITATDKRNEDLSFQINYQKNGKVTDSYQFDYIEGSNFMAKIENQLSKKLNKKITNQDFLNEFSSYQVNIKPTLNQLDIEYQDALIDKKNLDDLPIYTIYAITTVEQMNTPSWKEKFDTLKQQTKQIKFQPKDYSLLICKKNNTNICIEIEGITDEVMDEYDLNIIFQEMLDNKENVKNKYGITYKQISKKVKEIKE